MKEVIRQTNIEIKGSKILSEVDRVSPEALAVAQGLTMPAQEGYSKSEPRFNRGGDIFMAEPGGGENMPINGPQSTAPENTGQFPQGSKKPVSAERMAMARKAMEALKDPNLSVDLRRFLEENAREIISAGATDEDESQNEQTSGARASEQVSTIDFDPTTYTSLKRIYQIYNQRMQKGMVGAETIKDTIKRIEDSLADPNVPDKDSDFATNIIDELENYLAQSSRGEDDSSQSERIQDQAKRTLEDLVEGQAAFLEIEAGITDPTLKKYIDEIKAGFKKNPPDKLEELKKAVERINKLGRVSAGEDEQTKREQDMLFVSQKNAILGRLGILARKVEINVNNLQNIERNSGAEGVFGERKLTYGEKNRIRAAKDINEIEDLFNRVFDKVDRRPNADFNTAFGTTGSYEYEEFMRVLNEAINTQSRAGNGNRVNELERIVVRLSNERAAREIIHNAYFAVITGQNTEALSNYMASFLTGYADLAFGKSGVVQAMHFYEQSLLAIREKHGGYLPAKDVIGDLKNNQPGEVNILAEELLRDANSEGRLMVDENGDPILDEHGDPKQLAKWEIDRALSFARGMSVVMGRSIEIAATSILPGTESGSSAFIDLFAQKIIQELFLRHSGVKFQTSEDNKVTRVLAYLLDRDKTPWSPKEIQEFDKMDLTDQIKVLNDLMPEGEERFMSILNPFRIGGWLSATGWRIGGDPENPGESAIKKMLSDGEGKWIGTGIILEKERGSLSKLESKDPEKKTEGELAKRKIEEALKRTADITPLRFFLNMRDFKERVILDLVEKENGIFTDTERKAIQERIKERIKQKKDARTNRKSEEARLLNEKFDEKEETPEQKDQKTKNREREREIRIAIEEVMGDPKFSKEMKALVLLQERALQQKSHTLVAQENELGRILQQTFLEKKQLFNPEVGEEVYLDAFVRRLTDKGWKTPFVFGTEDIPFNKYVFEETGARSGARRWADMAAAAKAGTAFNEFLNGIEHYTEQGQIVEAMYKIYYPIKDYNLEYAEEFMQQLAEGVMKFYGKSWLHRLPLGIGTANSMINGESSYAQIAFGRGKMAWDELQNNEFTRLLRDKGIIKVEQQHELQGRAGGGKKEVVWGYTRTVLPLVMLALTYYMLSQAAKEKP